MEGKLLRSTEERCEQTFAFEKQGLSRTDARRKAKINGSTYYTWLKANHPDTLRKPTRKTPYTTNPKRRTTKPIITLPIDNGGQVTFNVKDFSMLCRELVGAH